MEEHKSINQHLKKGRFFRVQKGGKAPALTGDWNNQTVNFDEAQTFLKEGFNVALVANDDIIVIDADKPESVEWCDKELPMTLTEETCSGGKHYFYIPMENIQNSIIGGSSNNKGEVRCHRQYVVITPSKAISKVDKTLRDYRVVRDVPLSEIYQKDIDRLLNFFSNLNLNITSSKMTQKECSTTFIAEKVLPSISPFVKDLITKKREKEELQLLGYPSRSERDMKIVSHLLNRGFGEYIFSIFKNYPCGDKFRNHPSGEKYLNKTIDEAIKFLGLRTRGDMDLESQIEMSPVMWLKRHLDDILLKINSVVDNTNLFKEGLLATLAFRIKMSQIKLERRIKELVEESKPRKLISMYDLSQTELKPQEYWVNPLIPKGGLVIIGSKPGVGKSLLIQSLTTSMLSVGSFLGYPCENHPKIILYSVDDSSESMLHRRNSCILKGLVKNPKFDREKLKNLQTSFTFNKSNLRKEMEIASKFDIIVLDSYRRVLSGEENNSETTNNFFNDFLKPLKELGKTIIILHHLKKANLEELDDADLQDTLRGSGDIVSQVDLAFILTSIQVNGQPPLKDIKDCILKVVKNRLGILFHDRKSNIVSNVCYRVTRDLQENSTTFDYVDPSFLKSPRERRRDTIKKILSENSSLTRDQIITQVSKIIGCSDIVIEKDIDSMFKSGDIVKEKFGSYSMKKEIMGSHPEQMGI